MLWAAVLMLIEPGLVDPRGRFRAPDATGTTARPAGVFGLSVPRTTPPLFEIVVPAWTMAALPTLLPPYAPKLDWYESMVVPRPMTTLLVFATTAVARAAQGTGSAEVKAAWVVSVNSSLSGNAQFKPAAATKMTESRRTFVTSAFLMN